MWKGEGFFKACGAESGAGFCTQVVERRFFLREGGIEFERGESFVSLGRLFVSSRCNLAKLGGRGRKSCGTFKGFQTGLSRGPTLLSKHRVNHIVLEARSRLCCSVHPTRDDLSFLQIFFVIFI